MMDRAWYDTILLALFVGFSFYKSIRIQKGSRVGIAFATYNLILAATFFYSAFLIPLMSTHPIYEERILTIFRILMVTSIIWAVFELERSIHKRLRGAVMGGFEEEVTKPHEAKHRHDPSPDADIADYRPGFPDPSDR
jgi:hypothetical protein